MLAVGVGAISLVRASELRRVIESCVNIHALFGLLLVGFSLMRLVPRRQQSRLEASVLCTMARELSRLLYLLIYGAIGVREIISITRHIVYGEPIDFAPGDRLHTGSNFAGLDLQNDFHALLASGLAVLVVVRVLLFTMWLRAADRSDVAAPGPVRYAKNSSEPKPGVKLLTLAAALTTICCLHGRPIVYTTAQFGSVAEPTLEHPDPRPSVLDGTF